MFRDPSVRDASSKGNVVQGTPRPRDTSYKGQSSTGQSSTGQSSKGQSSKGQSSKGQSSKGQSSKRQSSKGHLVQGTHRSRDTSSKEHIVQGTHRSWDTSFKGRNIRDFSFADTLVGDEIRGGTGWGCGLGGGGGGKGNFRPSFDCFLPGSSWEAHRLGIRPVYPYFQ